jgi:hypothetical protein
MSSSKVSKTQDRTPEPFPWKVPGGADRREAIAGTIGYIVHALAHVEDEVGEFEAWDDDAYFQLHTAFTTLDVLAQLAAEDTCNDCVVHSLVEKLRAEQTAGDRPQTQPATSDAKPVEQASAETRMAATYGLLVGTLGSIREYTADDLRTRIRFAAAMLNGNQETVKKAAEADGEMQRNFDEDGHRITDVEKFVRSTRDRHSGDTISKRGAN